MSFYIPVNKSFSLTVDEMNNDQLRMYALWFTSSFAERMKVLIKQIKATPGYEKWTADFSPQSLEGLGAWFFAQLTQLKSRSKNVNEILDAIEEWFGSRIQPEVHGITPQEVFQRFKGEYLPKLKKGGAPGATAMEWFYENIRSKSEEDEDFAKMESEWKIIALGEIVDPLCISYSSDVGMYLSKVFSLYLKEHFPQLKWHPAIGNRTYIHYHSHTEMLDADDEKINFDPISAVIHLGFDHLESAGKGLTLTSLFDIWTNCMPIYADQLPIFAELESIGIKVKSLWDFRYEQNPAKRERFSAALPILCKHLLLPQHPYIKEALAAALGQEEFRGPVAAEAASDLLQRANSSLPYSVETFLQYAISMGNAGQPLSH